MFAYMNITMLIIRKKYNQAKEYVDQYQAILNSERYRGKTL